MRNILLLTVLISSTAFAIPCSVTKTWNVKVTEGQGIGGSGVSQTSVKLDEFEIDDTNPRKKFAFESISGSAMVGMYDSLYLEITDGKSTSTAAADSTKGAALAVSNGKEEALDYVSFAISCMPAQTFSAPR